MTTVAQLAHQFRTTFTATPTTRARSSGFITRQGKLTATAFVRGLTFGWLAHPDARYRQLARAVNQAGSPITPQALEQRFTAEAATLLQQVLAHAVTAVIGAPEVVPSLLDRFTAVWALDSSTITLPAALQATWEGSGRSAEQGGTAGLKTPVALDLRSGRLRGPLLGDAKPQDKRSPLQPADTWERGRLRLTDLGFSSLRVLRDLSQRGVFWLCRAQVQTHLVTADGRRWTLRQLLTAQHTRGRSIWPSRWVPPSGCRHA